MPDRIRVTGGTFPGGLSCGLWGKRLALRDQVDVEVDRPVDRDQTTDRDRQRRQVISCRTCRHRLTDSSQRIEVAGAHRHTFFNPAGIVYELGCFAAAPGIRLTGEASGEFAWFAGYLWRIGLCGGCGTHLGWHFERGESSFFGLILAGITDDLQ